MKVYESVIEICMYPIFDDSSWRGGAVEEEFESVRKLYFKPTKDAPAGTTT